MVGERKRHGLFLSPCPSSVPPAFDVWTLRLPGVTLDAYPDLGLHSGEQVCFSVQAYNGVGTSAGSAPVCVTVN